MSYKSIWSLGSASSWLLLNSSGGATPDTAQVTADISGLDLDVHSGQVVLRSDSLGKEAAVSIRLSVVDEIFRNYLPAVVLDSPGVGLP